MTDDFLILAAEHIDLTTEFLQPLVTNVEVGGHPVRIASPDEPIERDLEDIGDVDYIVELWLGLSCLPSRNESRLDSQELSKVLLRQPPKSSQPGKASSKVVHE